MRHLFVLTLLLMGASMATADEITLRSQLISPDPWQLDLVVVGESDHCVIELLPCPDHVPFRGAGFQSGADRIVGSAGFSFSQNEPGGEGKTKAFLGVDLNYNWFVLRTKIGLKLPDEYRLTGFLSLPFPVQLGEFTLE